MSNTVQISFTKEELNYLENLAKREDLTVPLYIKTKVLENTEFNKYFKELKEKVNRIKPGTEFNIKAVFGTDWLNIPKGVRLALGRIFYKYVAENNIKVTIKQKDASNTQWYIKE